MTVERVTLEREKETLLITLYAKAGESWLRDSRLRDRFAARAVERIDYDFSRLKVSRDMMVGLGLRAAMLDDWVRDFIGAHSRCIILNLGCGLDARVHRIDPPASVSWYDVDFPEVIELRQLLYPSRPSHTQIGSSVTDLAWLDQVPGDQPAMVIAEGLFMYLSEREMQSLLEAIVARFASGELGFDALSRWGVWFVQRQPSVRATGARLRWGIDDPAELQRLVPRLRLVEAQAPYPPDQLHRFSTWGRIGIRMMRAVPALRRLGRLLRYAF